MPARLLDDHGPRCTAIMLWNVLLRAAARMVSLAAACRDLAAAPTDTAVFGALEDLLPKTLKLLERRMNDLIAAPLPRKLRRRAWEVAIDWHLQPYYGQPYQSRNEIYYGKPRQGTKKFHAYATACIVVAGQRYTLALTWVRRHESMATVLARLLAMIDRIGLKIRCLLLDRAFFNVPVAQLLQSRKLPFVMPVMFRGRPPKKGRPRRGLRWIKRQSAGWYTHTLKNGRRTAEVKVCVSYRTHKHRRDGRRVQQKLLFAAWRVSGSPVEIRERYRKRFGIETSYRQMRQARIYTTTRNPRLRLLFVAVALMLRNLWVWLHAEHLTAGRREQLDLGLHRLPFKRLLDWLAQTITTQLHDGSEYEVSLLEAG